MPLGSVLMDPYVELTATEAAEAFGVSESTIRAWRRRGHLPLGGLGTRDGRTVPIYKVGDIERAAAATKTRTAKRRTLVGSRCPS